MRDSNEATFWSRASFRIMDVPYLLEVIIAQLDEGTENHKEGEIRTRAV